MLKTENTFLFVPNIIDYGRVIALLGVMYLAFECPITTMILYALSQILDAFDGMAARALGQCNEFGKVLDMVCDRASDAVMLAILSGLYPQYRFFFLVAMALDIVSHWYQQYATQYCREEHHKTAKTNWKVLHIYYNNKAVLFSMVLGFETFLVNMYLKAFEHSLDIPDSLKIINTGLLYISLPVFLAKNYVSLIQLFSASQKICDAEKKFKLQNSKKSN